jgi:hypothetical protein
VETQVHPLVYQAGTETGQCFYEDMLPLFRVGLPFLQKWTRLPDDYHEIYQQTLKERNVETITTTLLATGYGLFLPGFGRSHLHVFPFF